MTTHTQQCTRLHLAAVRVHLSICATYRSAQRAFGLTFTPSGVPGIAHPNIGRSNKS